jgi:Bacterial regulatory proteins, luxR family
MSAHETEPFGSLSSREQQVAALVSAGFSNKIVARELDLTEGTVKQHVHNIFLEREAVQCSSFGQADAQSRLAWGTGADESFTLEIGQTPLPAALPLFATGIGGLGLLGWRRKRKA